MKINSATGIFNSLLIAGLAIGASLNAISDEVWEFYGGPIRFTNDYQGIKPLDTPVLTEQAFFGVYLGEPFDKVVERSKSIPLSFTNNSTISTNPLIQSWITEGSVNKSTNVMSTTLTTINGRVYSILIKFSYTHDLYLGLFEKLNQKYKYDYNLESSNIKITSFNFRTNSFPASVSLIRRLHNPSGTVSLKYQYDAMALPIDNAVKKHFRDSIKEEL